MQYGIQIKNHSDYGMVVIFFAFYVIIHMGLGQKKALNDCNKAFIVKRSTEHNKKNSRSDHGKTPHDLFEHGLTR